VYWSGAYARVVGDKARQVPIVRWTTEEAKKLADLISVFDDLDFVVGSCERLRSLDGDASADQIVVRALWNAALVAYARCWATGVRTGISTDVFEELEGDPYGLHEYLKNLRDKHIAHSVNPFEDVAIGLALSPEDQADRTVIGVASLLQKLISFDRAGIDGFGSLATVARGAIAAKCSEQKDVVEAEGRATDIAVVLTLPELKLVTPGPEHVTQSRLRRAPGDPAHTQPAQKAEVESPDL
jgi:hypothetical protein